MMAEMYAYMHACVYRICCCIHFTRLIHAYFFSCLNVIKLAYFLINKLHQPIVPFLSCQRLITHFHGCSSLYAHTGTGTHQHQPFIGTLHIFSFFFTWLHFHDLAGACHTGQQNISNDIRYEQFHFILLRCVSFCCVFVHFTFGIWLAQHFVLCVFIRSLAFG